MTTHTIIFKHTGEISYTPRTPYAVAPRPDLDLSATKTALASSDMWQPVEVDLYETGEVELPAWLDPETWIANPTVWKWTWGFGADKAWPEAWQRFLAYQTKGNGAAKLACVKLLKTKKFRSEFRASLRRQLETWLDTPEEERRYESPFSPKQWHALIDHHMAMDAKRLDSALYHA